MLDSDSFAERFRECYDRLWLVAAAVTGDRTYAEDIVQDAAMIAYRKRAQFVPGTNFGAWMTQIVRLTAYNHGRKQRDRGTRSTDPTHLDHLPRQGNSPNDAAAVNEQGGIDPLQSAFDDQFLAALMEVGEVPRICLLLRVVRELNYAEISELLDMPEGTAMSHVHRAKRVLRDRLRDHDRSRVP